MADQKEASEAAKNREIKISSSDDEIFLVPRNVIRLSNTLNTLLVDLGLDDDEGTNAEPIPVQNVTASILKKVINWCTKHQSDPIPTEDSEKKTDGSIQDWDKKFLDIDQGTLFELILAANYLDIKGLLDVACQSVANMIKGKSPDEIRRAFNIKDDFTAEEREQIRKENAWC